MARCRNCRPSRARAFRALSTEERARCCKRRYRRYVPEPVPTECPECIELIYIFQEGGSQGFGGAQLAATGSFGGKLLYTPISQFGPEDIPLTIYASGGGWAIGVTAGLGNVADISQDCPISFDWSMNIDGQYYTYECGNCDCITAEITAGSAETYNFRKYNEVNGRDSYVTLVDFGSPAFLKIEWDGSKWVLLTFDGLLTLASLEEDTECPLSADGWGDFNLITGFNTELCAE